MKMLSRSGVFHQLNCFGGITMEFAVFFTNYLTLVVTTCALRKKAFRKIVLFDYKEQQ